MSNDFSSPEPPRFDKFTGSEFRHRLDQLGEVNWTAVAATDFRDAAVKEGKQAEFLLHGFFAWRLVRRVGVLSRPVYAWW